ncbi:MAG: helix-turn-helix domain-containing protein [Hominimerdicola sp.]
MNTNKKIHSGSFGIFVTALEFIEENLCDEFTQEDIAKACCCSLSTLQKLWRYCTHTSIKEYITKRRLTRAGVDLLNSDMTVLDTAMKYGYNSHEVFTRAFVKVWGISPAKFKKEWKGNCGLFPPLNPEYYEGADIMGNKKFDVTELFDYLKERIGTYVLCFDVVGLHAVNTEIGREAGDKMILESLKRISDAAEDDMLVFRIGGDEFVMVTGLDDVDEVVEYGKKVLVHNGEKVKYSGGELALSLRAGAIAIRKPLKYTGLFNDFDIAIGKARDTGEIEFA